MKNPIPDAAGRFAHRFSPIRDAALKLGDQDKVIRLDLDVTYVTAVDICQKVGIPDPQPVDSTLLSRCRAFRDACDAHLSRDDSGRVRIARAAFAAIAEVEAALSPRGPVVGPNLDTATVFLMGKRFGEASSSIGWLISGVLEEYGKSVHTFQKTGASRRGIVPKWQADFLPVAVEYCSGKAKVTLGELVREARRWAESEIALTRNPGIPAREAGIMAGLRRMESRGLSIPGRKRN